MHRSSGPAIVRARAGAKGIMLFQSELRFLNAPNVSASWATLGVVMREIGALREVYRAGDITQMVAATYANGTGDPGVVADVIWSERALVVVLINVATVDGSYTDLACGIGLDQHWQLIAHAIDRLAITVPPGFSIVDSFEVSNAAVVPGTVVAVSGCGAALPSVRMSAIPSPPPRPPRSQRRVPRW
jgi:hypothetical protein